MDKHLKILLLEDSEDDVNLIHLELKNGGIQFTSLLSDTREEFIKGINEFKPDLVLSDHAMLNFNSGEALKIFKDHLKKEKQSAPFILVTGTVSEEFAVQCITNGADDYILKDRLQRLPAAIQNALDKCRTENENRQTTAEKLLLLERYEFATKTTSEAIWDWDLINNSIYCGQGFEKIFGHTCNDENNHLNTAYISLDDIERVVDSLNNAIEGTDTTWFDEYQYLKATGDYAFVQDNAIILRNNEGKAVRMIGAMVDITSKKQEDLRLKLLESVIRNITDAVLIAETNITTPGSLKIVYVNEAFVKMTGYEHYEVIGRSPGILQGEKTSKEELERLRIALNENEPCQVEMISYKKNGDEFWLHFSVTPIAAAGGTFSHWVFIERDITEQRNRTKAIENQNLQLKEIAWMQSHVVRAPLARMMGFINLIDSNKNQELQNKELLPYVLDSAKELDRIIREIVDKTEKLNNK